MLLEGMTWPDLAGLLKMSFIDTADRLVVRKTRIGPTWLCGSRHILPRNNPLTECLNSLGDPYCSSTT